MTQLEEAKHWALAASIVGGDHSARDVVRACGGRMALTERGRTWLLEQSAAKSLNGHRARLLLEHLVPNRKAVAS
jgi:hypothetical protein